MAALLWIHSKMVVWCFATVVVRLWIIIQKEIYDIVDECHDLALSVAKPGVKYFDVHLAVCRLMTERLKELGLMKGDVDEAVAAGAHAMFLPHGLGHMMGMDVHDMEGLGQIYVGFDEETRPNLEQFGTNCLRMGRRLEEGFVVTDEPGIYFIPALIDDWRSKGHCKDFINYDLLETYKDFGGIRIEDQGRLPFPRRKENPIPHQGCGGVYGKKQGIETIWKVNYKTN